MNNCENLPARLTKAVRAAIRASLLDILVYFSLRHGGVLARQTGLEWQIWRWLVKTAGWVCYTLHWEPGGQPGGQAAGRQSE